MNGFRVSLQAKIALGSLLLALLLSIAICAVSYISYRSSLIERYTTVAEESADLARKSVDGDRVAEYLDTLVKDDLYTGMQERFNEIKASFNLMFLYMHIPDGEYMRYIVDAYVPDDNFDNISDLGGADILWDGSRDIVMGVYENGPKDGVIFMTNEDYGYMATALLPVYDSSGGITALIGADISMDLVTTKLNSYIRRIALLTLFIVFGFIILALVIVRRTIIRPLRHLADAAGGFAAGAETLSFEKVHIRSQDELHTLATAFNKMAEDMILHVSHVKKITAEKERIGAELNVATQIQASMLPCIFPAFPEHSEFDIYASMQPAKEVGGDFYDFFLIDEDTLAVVIADVSGKGVPAALFMVIAKTLIKNNAQYGKSPKEVFETVNNLLCENNEAGMFVTAFMGYLNIPSGRFTYVNAGHNAPLHRSGGHYDWLKSQSGFVLAGMENMRYTQNEITLKPGDELFLYTDGVTEAVDRQNNLFSDEKLLHDINKHTNKEPSALLAAIKHEIDNFADGAEQADDITMLSLYLKD